MSFQNCGSQGLGGGQELVGHLFDGRESERAGVRVEQHRGVHEVSVAGECRFDRHLLRGHDAVQPGGEERWCVHRRSAVYAVAVDDAHALGHGIEWEVGALAGVRDVQGERSGLGR